MKSIFDETLPSSLMTVSPCGKSIRHHVRMSETVIYSVRPGKVSATASNQIPKPPTTHLPIPNSIHDNLGVTFDINSFSFGNECTQKFPQYFEHDITSQCSSKWSIRMKTSLHILDSAVVPFSLLVERVNNICYNL